MSKPFAGVRILDFTRYLAGPYGTYQLALLGAGEHTDEILAEAGTRPRRSSGCAVRPSSDLEPEPFEGVGAHTPGRG